MDIHHRVAAALMVATVEEEIGAMMIARGAAMTGATSAAMMTVPGAVMRGVMSAGMIAVETDVMMIGVTDMTDAAMVVVGVAPTAPLLPMSTPTARYVRSMATQQVIAGGATQMTRRRRMMIMTAVTRVPTLHHTVLT